MNHDQSHIDALIHRVKDGGAEHELAELFQYYQQRLKTLVSLRMDRRLVGRVDPSDVLQEAYLDLAQRLSKHEQRRDMSPFVWMRLVVAERLQKFHRTHLGTEMRDLRKEIPIHGKQHFPNATSMSLAAALLGKYSSVVQRAVHRETQLQLHEKIEQMEQNDQEIILLRLFEELSNSETAEVLGLSKHAASKRYIRAIKRLREMLMDIPGFDEFSSSRPDDVGDYEAENKS